MPEQKTKTKKFNEESIKELPNDKPVVYKILNNEDKNVYTGIAKRGRVNDRLIEHLSGGPDPIPGGVKVKIERMSSIEEARKKETNIIARAKPKHNKQGK